jgi:phosphatidylglycerol:prolipoprotein diacylglycerol transferase
MYPHLFSIPVFVILALAGALAGTSLAAGFKNGLMTLGGGALGAAAGAGIAFTQPWGYESIAVQSYGTMILVGFIVAVWITGRRSRLIGVDPQHVLDIGVYGVFVGLAGSRLFDVLMNWGDFNPFQPGGFEAPRILDMFKLWKGGLVFYGCFITVIPYGFMYCKRHKLPGQPFIDMLIISVVTGLAFGRIGCFLNGCCFGKVCNLPWAVHFPARFHPDGDAPAHAWHVAAGWITPESLYSMPVHPTQIYASVAAMLTAGFLYAYWPRRRYDGQILALAMIMVGATRFFEELLRDDEGAVFPSISSWMTIAQWVALGLITAGFALMYYFRRRATLYKFTPVQAAANSGTGGSNVRVNPGPAPSA